LLWLAWLHQILSLVRVLTTMGSQRFNQSQHVASSFDRRHRFTDNII